jgi:hypothetical protein
VKERERDRERGRKFKLVKVIFKISVRNSKKAQHFTIININWLMLNPYLHWVKMWKVKLPRYRHAGTKEEKEIYYDGEWSESSPGRALPPGTDPGTHWTGGWVGLWAGLDTDAREKTSASAGDQTPVVRSVVRHYTVWATPAPWSCPATPCRR